MKNDVFENSAIPKLTPEHTAALHHQEDPYVLAGEDAEEEEDAQVEEEEDERQDSIPITRMSMTSAQTDAMLAELFGDSEEQEAEDEEASAGEPARSLSAADEEGCWLARRRAANEEEELLLKNDEWPDGWWLDEDDEWPEDLEAIRAALMVSKKLKAQEASDSEIVMVDLVFGDDFFEQDRSWHDFGTTISGI